MSEYMYGKPSKWDKVVPIVAGTVLLAFFAYVPTMVANKNERLEKAWQEKGCQMYDDYKPADIPAKCSSYFIDHYQAQKARIQPPESE